MTQVVEATWCHCRRHSTYLMQPVSLVVFRRWPLRQVRHDLRPREDEGQPSVHSAKELYGGVWTARCEGWTGESVQRKQTARWAGNVWTAALLCARLRTALHLLLACWHRVGDPVPTADCTEYNARLLSRTLLTQTLSLLACYIICTLLCSFSTSSQNCEKLLLASSYPSVSPRGTTPTPTARILITVDIWASFFENLSRKFKFH